MEKGAVKIIFGMKIHLLRTQKGLTLAQLAEKTGTVVSYLSDIEKGKKYPKHEKIIALSEALDTPYDTLVALGGLKQLQPIVDLVSSDFFKDYPLDMFGLRPDRILELVAGDPSKISALVSAIVKISRSYDLNRENLYTVALRSYQDIHDNYFGDLEDAAEQFAARYALNLKGEQTLSSATTEALLQSAFGITVDRKVLPDRPDFRHIRSYYGHKKRILYLNTGFSAAQERFLIGREIGFQALNIKDRPYETIIQRAGHFDKLLHNFQASYFASAMLMPRATFAEDIRRCAGQLEWNASNWLALLDRYNVTPEMLLQRMTNILPGMLGLNDLFFIRLQGDEKLNRFDMTKELHLNGRQSPYASERELHYCRRWVSVEILRQMRLSGSLTPMAMAQISEYHDTDNRYLVISMAKPGRHYTQSGVSVSIGLRITDDMQRIFRFAGDPNVVRKTVGSTCETCALTPCNSRAAAPENIEKERELNRLMQELQALD